MINTLVLSIVVTAYTTERLNDIYELLDSIKSQSYPHIETIFVAERSTELLDKVKSYVSENRINDVKLLFNDGEAGLSAARNLGIEQVQGNIIAFVDDDVILFHNWAEEMVKTYKDDSVIGVTGPALPLWKDTKISWFPEEFYWVISCTAWYDSGIVKEVRNAWGHSMSFRKEAFKYCRFVDTFGRTEGANKAGKKGPVGDDTEFCINLRNKSGKTIVYNPEVKVLHKVYSYRLTPAFIRRQAYWQGYTKAMFKKLYDKKEKNERILATEYQLLRRILFILFPSMLLGFFHHPAFAWKRFKLSTTVMLHLSIGYFSAVWSWFGTQTTRAYGAQ